MAQERAQNIEENREQWTSAPYYDMAERDIDWQWNRQIWPLIRASDFSVTLELAPGHGRNTAKLIALARELHLVDVTPACIDFCRGRFGDRQGAAQIHYYFNDGRSLPEQLANRVTHVYCWDAMVHFELAVIECYLAEFRRVLAPGATAFLHHSDIKNCRAEALGKWIENPHWRAPVAREDVSAAAVAAGLEVTSQTLVPWGGGEINDCITMLRRSH